MSAETLRRAAALMRSGEDWPLDADVFALAVADWLGYIADQAAKLDALGVAPEKRSRVQHLAFAVARAYLGEQS